MQQLAPPPGVLVSHAMTEQVVTVRPDATLWDATRLLREADISGLPVVDRSGRLVGILSEKDIARAVGEVAGQRNVSRLLDLLVSGRGTGGNLGDLASELLQNTKVSEVMNHDPVVTSPSTPLDTAAKILLERHINRLPVVKGGHLVGILTRHDILASSV
ncbi:MAG: CBS domain-containing protein [Euryarchaeota archaeon]|nr:CBS domain-containing protein [Euryarchaeota archaeon]MDE1835377.1 CBS domain-containing protein [Euryarchaeota archaeon]MDE1880480.1 CBS domain-containing protein [Euryarchaeota archaeon]MDE2043673.1 CBS domain-containing protein [Thermoplasmata archaeon]